MRLRTPSDEELYRRLEQLARRYEVHSLALEMPGMRRGKRGRVRTSNAVNWATLRQLPVHCIGASHVRQALGLPPRATHDQVNERIAKQFPELRTRMPRHSVWRRDPQVYVFRAISLTLAERSLLG